MKTFAGKIFTGKRLWTVAFGFDFSELREDVHGKGSSPASCSDSRLWFRFPEEALLTSGARRHPDRWRPGLGVLSRHLPWRDLRRRWLEDNHTGPTFQKCVVAPGARRDRQIFGTTFRERSSPTEVGFWASQEPVECSEDYWAGAGLGQVWPRGSLGTAM